MGGGETSKKKRNARNNPWTVKERKENRQGGEGKYGQRPKLSNNSPNAVC